MNITPNNEQDITNICRIAQGLLASGHYTDCNDNSKATDMHDAPAWPKTKDNGKDWKEGYLPRRIQSYAVRDAIELYDQIRDDWQHYEDLMIEPLSTCQETLKNNPALPHE